MNARMHLVTLIRCLVVGSAVCASNVANNNASTPTITITKLNINDTKLELCYEIKNNSQQEIWICDSVSEEYNFEVFLDEDGQTLIVRKRLEVPTPIS